MEILQLVSDFLVAIIVSVLAFVVLKEKLCSDKSSIPSNRLFTKFVVDELK
tara:strand:+ start:767 stop:919 length:153 start_codon:yes stop_codon:yes gene_type:complete